MKDVFNRCVEDGTDANLATLQLRTILLDSRIPSPGELLQNRQQKTMLPSISRPAPNNEPVRDSLQSRQDYCRYDTCAKEFPQLLPTQPVRLQDHQTKKRSISGEVLCRAETPHSYLMKTPKGVVRWNRIQIKEVALPVNLHTSTMRLIDHHRQLMCSG